jgi:hypothetical protein
MLFGRFVVQFIGDAKQNRVAGPGIRSVRVRFRGARLPQLEASADAFAIGQIHTYSDQPRAIDI